MGGGDEEVAAAAGGVADREVEDGLLGVLGLLGVVQDRVEGGVEDEVDQIAGRVVAAGGLALVAGDGLQGEDLARRITAGDELEEGLVDRAEFFGTEVAEVDVPSGLALGLDDR